MFCYAEKVPNTQSDAFFASNIKNATLHVPAGSIDAYKAASPWNDFKAIVAIEGGVEPEKGDLNGDGVLDANDVATLVMVIARGDAFAVGDLNGDGKVDIADVIVLVNIITGK
jgi:hypothetical protein